MRWRRWAAASAAAAGLVIGSITADRYVEFRARELPASYYTVTNSEAGHRMKLFAQYFSYHYAGRAAGHSRRGASAYRFRTHRSGGVFVGGKLPAPGEFLARAVAPPSGSSFCRDHRA